MRNVWQGRLSLLLLTLVEGCASDPKSRGVETTTTTRTAASPKPVSEVAESADEWGCGGDLVPPSGWQQETAFEQTSTPGARELASQHAGAKLRERLCTTLADCDYLNAHIRTWRTGSSAKDTCAMAVIKSEELDEWRGLSRTLANLDGKLKAAAGELLKAGSNPTQRVAIDRVVDMGVPGGQRADWLRARMERELQRHATIIGAPRGWAGDGVPPGVDIVVRAEVVARTENGIPSLESNWVAISRSGGRIRSAPVTFPETASPHAPGSPPPPTIPESEGISVRMDSGRGGSICAGERTQLWLKSDSAVSVRVFDLYGEGEAILMYPNEDQPNAHVAAAQTVALGGALGFEAVPTPGSEVERFLVVAAPNEAALGALGKVKGTCRVSAARAKQLHRGQGLPPGARLATTGYRLTKGGTCPPAVAQRDGEVQAIQSLPECDLR